MLIKMNKQVVVDKETARVGDVVNASEAAASFLCGNKCAVQATEADLAAFEKSKKEKAEKAKK